MSFYVSVLSKEDLAKAREHEKPYLILAYYHLTTLDDPQAEIAEHRAYFTGRDVKSRIYISKQGINGTLSAPIDEAYSYMQWLSDRDAFQGIKFKLHEWHTHAFPRLAIKIRKELVAFGEEISLKQQGMRVSPSKWARMLEDEDKVLVDVRNDYEWNLGHFTGAENPDCTTFRDFKAYAEQLKKKVEGKNTKVMMYCTGGIRCEFFSAILVQQGIKEVYQLDGGIINYGAQEKAKHWEGKLFVFDDRLTVPLSSDDASIIGACHHCKKPIDVYYNCSNTDCNELFLCCPDCLKEYAGSCCIACSQAECVRPFQLAHTPFRRRHTYKDLAP